MRKLSFWTRGSLYFVILLAGCSRTPSHPAAIPGKAGLTSSSQTLTLTAVDNSGSTGGQMRKELVSTVYDVATELNPDVDAFAAYVFASDIREVASEVPRDEDAFATLLSSDVMPTSKDFGTDYSKVMLRLADVSAKSTARSIRLIIAGDGFTDFSNSAVTRRFVQAGKELAENPRVTAVVLYGIKTGAREKLEPYLKGGSYQLHFIDLGQPLPKFP